MDRLLRHMYHTPLLDDSFDSGIHSECPNTIFNCLVLHTYIPSCLNKFWLVQLTVEET